MKEKTQYQIKKDRVYEIYGIDRKDRKKYSIHHIVFKSDPKNHSEFRNFDVNRISNLCPLLREDHKDLHNKIGS